ncbi:unnamed protein product [Prunus armeniaca]|uniref:Uncharacterized protein n=1 Tax=Prunus armeniaca TaxID=36596 RepID=A0A6J5VFB2_PRUAR|nr:unnamed protein product [Prunus armeniaca]
MASTDASKALFLFNFHIRYLGARPSCYFASTGGSWRHLAWKSRLVMVLEGNGDLSYCYFKVREVSAALNWGLLY